MLEPEVGRFLVWWFLIGIPAVSLIGSRFGVGAALFSVASFLIGTGGGLLYRWPPANWHAIAALATLAAVVAALLPIWIDAARRAHRARTLRIRIGARLASLRPTLASFFLSAAQAGSPILSAAQFQQVVADLDSLMSEAGVLRPDEQDHLGMTLYNLSLAGFCYASAVPIPPDSARHFITLIDHCLSLFEGHGLVGGPLTKPWKDTASR